MHLSGLLVTAVWSKVHRKQATALLSGWAQPPDGMRRAAMRWISMVSTSRRCAGAMGCRADRARLTPKDLDVVEDADQNGVPEVAALLVRDSDGRMVPGRRHPGTTGSRPESSADDAACRFEPADATEPQRDPGVLLRAPPGPTLY